MPDTSHSIPQPWEAGDMSAGPLVLPLAGVAAMCGGAFSSSKIYEMIASGELEALKVGGRTLVTMASLRALIARSPRVVARGRNRPQGPGRGTNMQVQAAE